MISFHIKFLITIMNVEYNLRNYWPSFYFKFHQLLRYNANICKTFLHFSHQSRHEKCLKMCMNHIFLILIIHTFFRNKLPNYEIVNEERDQNLYIWSKSLLILKFLPSIWSICSRKLWFVVDLLLFSHKCSQTRFMCFAVFFMSERILDIVSCISLNYELSNLSWLC